MTQQFQLNQKVYTPLGKPAYITDFTNEGGIERVVLAYEYGDGQIVELQPKLLREV